MYSSGQKWTGCLGYRWVSSRAYDNLSFCGAVPLFSILFSVVVINQAQERCPGLLPPLLRTWTFLPSYLRHTKQANQLTLNKIFWSWARVIFRVTAS